MPDLVPEVISQTAATAAQDLATISQALEGLQDLIDRLTRLISEPPTAAQLSQIAPGQRGLARRGRHGWITIVTYYDSTTPALELIPPPGTQAQSMARLLAAMLVEVHRLFPAQGKKPLLFWDPDDVPGRIRVLLS